MASNLLDRMTSDSTKCGGKPRIREMRIRVADNTSAETILADFPDLELGDIQACLRFSSHSASLQLAGCRVYS